MHGDTERRLELVATAVLGFDQLVTADDPAAESGFERTYRAHHAGLVRFVRRCAVDRGLSEAQLDAEGIAHEAFTLALRHWDTIGEPQAWLFTVARRLVGKAHAQTGRQATAADISVLDGPTVRWSTLVPPASAEDAHAAREVMTAISRLSGRQRVATYLRHVEGWSCAEIADLLGCAPKTVSVHVHRGLSALLGGLAVLAAFAAAAASYMASVAKQREAWAPTPCHQGLCSPLPYFESEPEPLLSAAMLVGIAAAACLLGLMLVRQWWVRTPEASDRRGLAAVAVPATVWITLVASLPFFLVAISTLTAS